MDFYQFWDELLPYIALLYLIDSAIFVRGHQFLIDSSGGRTFSLRGSGLHWSGLSPIAKCYSLVKWDPPLTNEGLYLPASGGRVSATPAPSEDSVIVAFDEIRNLQVENHILRCNGRKALKGFPKKYLQQLASIIACLKAETMALRQPVIADFVASRAGLRPLQEQRRSLRFITGFRDVASLFSFSMVFLAIPSSLYLSFPPGISPKHLTYALFTGFILVIVVETICRIVSRSTGTWSTMITGFMSPLAFLHLNFSLERDRFVTNDYLAVAALLLTTEEFISHFRCEMCRLHLTLHNNPGHPTSGYWRLKEQAWRTLLAQLELAPAAALAPPNRKDPAATGYCPLCEIEYLAGIAACADCGVALRRY